MKNLRLVLFGLLMTVFSASSAYALPTVTITWANNQSHSWGGGEFTLATSNIGTFNSFCVEEDEFINIGGQYTYTISDYADDGGINTPNPDPVHDPVSLGSAWLFWQFQTGLLTSGYGYTHTLAQQLSLQQAFWMLEGELTPYNAANEWLVIARNALGVTDAQLQANSNGAYGVQVMNLWNMNGTNAQDQLVMVPDGGTTLTLLGLAFGGMAMFSRRFRKA